MDSKEYFEKYKLNIKKTAEFLAEKDDEINGDFKFIELKQQYYEEDGTKNKQEINIRGKSIDISGFLNGIRNADSENFKIYSISQNNDFTEIYSTRWNQFYSYVDLNKIHVAIYDFIKTTKSSMINLFIIHNHPFIYKASPSGADTNTLKAIFEEISSIEKIILALTRIKIFINIVVFSIVTAFEYWSFKQSS